jgi:ERCC4-type nuclease
VDHVILVSPAEPAPVKRSFELACAGAGLRWATSAIVEPMGVDFAWTDGAGNEFVGMQRKELKDFIASAVQDDRLQREIGQMRGRVSCPMVVIEGKIKFTNDDVLLWNSWGQTITRKQWDGMLFSLAHQGVHVRFTQSIDETTRLIVNYYQWSQKERHSSLMTRPGPTSVWGRVDNRDYAIHLVQGLPGIGYELAARIVDRCSEGGAGMVPFVWREDVTRDVLTSVDGIGKVKADKILNLLGRAGHQDG